MEQIKQTIYEQNSDDHYKALADKWRVESIRPVNQETIEEVQRAFNDRTENPDYFYDTLEDASAELLENNNSQYLENIKALHNTHDKDEQKKITESQKSLFTDAGHFIMALANIDDGAVKTEKEKARDKIRNVLTKAREQDGEDYDPLAVLGMLQENENGDEIFVYPESLFPKEMNEHWHKYVRAVEKHLEISDNLITGVTSQDDVKDADAVRRSAHNAFAQDLQDVIGDPGDDFQEYRKLAIKMREHQFSNRDTKEKVRTNLMIGKTVTDSLRKHALPDGAVWGGSDY